MAKRPVAKSKPRAKPAPARRSAAKKAPAKKKKPAKKPVRTRAPRLVETAAQSPDLPSVSVPETIEPPVAVPTLIPQPHGGALLAGGMPGNAGGGRPRDAVRAAFLGVSAKGAAFLDRLMDGIVDVSFVGTCPHCGEESEPPVGSDLVKAIVAGVGKSVEARLRSTEIAARHGLGAKELVIASPSAGAFFDCVHTAITELYGTDAAEAVKARAVNLMDEVKAV